MLVIIVTSYVAEMPLHNSRRCLLS